MTAACRFFARAARAGGPEAQRAPDHAIGIGGWVLAGLGPLAVSGVLVGLRGQFKAVNVALVLVVVVLGAAIVGARRGGVIAAFVSAACFDFFFTRPYYSFTIDRRDDIETTIVLLIVGLTVGELVVRSRRSRRLARTSRREVEQIRHVAEVAAGGEPKGSLIAVVQREVVAILGARGARFERPPFATSLPRLGHGHITIQPADPTIPPAGPRNEVELPVWGGGREIGRLVIVLPTDSIGLEASIDDRALASALADQLGAILAASERDH